MAKKATTIILFIVVLLLLGSTVYVSIILTTEESPTTARNTRASEIDSDLTETTNDPFAQDTTETDADTTTTTDAGTTDETTVISGGDPLDPAAEPTLGTEPLETTTATDTETDTGTETTTDTAPTLAPADGGQDLAYLNPTPVVDDAEDDVFAEPTAEPTDVTDLPETGKGQTIPSVSPTFAPTMAASATPMKVQPTQTVNLPTAGFGIGIATSVIAGVTILASLFL